MQRIAQAPKARSAANTTCITFGKRPRPLRLAAAAARPPRRQCVALAGAAAAGGESITGPAYNKYRTRQDIERTYFKEWEETTVQAEHAGMAPMTPLTLLAFLPAWFWFFVVPGPLRFLVHLALTTAGRLLFQLRKRAVLAGAELDAVLERRSGRELDGAALRKTALQRLHGKRSVVDLRYRLQLLTGAA